MAVLQDRRVCRRACGRVPWNASGLKQDRHRRVLKIREGETGETLYLCLAPGNKNKVYLLTSFCLLL